MTKLKSGSSKRSKLASDRGAAAVEFAIILPLLLLLLLLLIDFGRLFFVEISLNGASREAARASALSMSISDIEAITNQATVGTTTISALSASDLGIVVQPCSATTPNDSTTVEVSTTFNWITPIELTQIFNPDSTLVDPWGTNITARGEMLCTES